MTDITGKIAALQPSFELMQEMTGSPSSATKMGLYATYFVEQHLAMNDVNLAVEELMVSHGKGFWPTPEVIAARAREMARRYAVKGTPRDILGMIDEVCAQADARKWEHRLQMANEWREKNPAAFKVLLASVDGDIKRLLEVIQLQWMVKSKLYRDAFRTGASVGACIRRAGDDERRQAKIDERDRLIRAATFGATNHIEDAA